MPITGTCHRIRRLVRRHLFAGEDVPRSPPVAEHLDRCPRCRQDLALLLGCQSRLRDSFRRAGEAMSTPQLDPATLPDLVTASRPWFARARRPLNTILLVTIVSFSLLAAVTLIALALIALGIWQGPS